MSTDYFNRILTVLLEYLDFCKLGWEGLANNNYLGGPGPCQACLLATALFETTVCHVLNVSAFLVSDYSCFMLELFLPKL